MGALFNIDGPPLRITKAVELSDRGGQVERAGIGCLVEVAGKALVKKGEKGMSGRGVGGNDVIRAALLCGLREIRRGGEPLLLAGVDCNHPVRNGLQRRSCFPGEA